MGELGELLRQSRESQGLSIDQVEEATRIRRVFIQALEDERFDDLPGSVYVKGFLRNYAQFLGLNQDEVLAEYHKLSGAAPRHVPRVLNEPLMRNPRPSLGSTVFLIVMILLVVAVAGWYGYQRFYLGNELWPSGSLSELFGGARPSVTATQPAAPTRQPTASLVPAQEQPTAEPTSMPTTTPQSELATPTQAPPTEAPRTAIPSPTPRPRVTRTATPTQAPTLTQAEQEAGIRVEARVLADTYVAGSLDGQPIEPVILRPGDDPVWTAEQTVTLRIGNGGGISLTVNGVDVGRLGADGEVVDVEYTLDTLPQG